MNRISGKDAVLLLGICLVAIPLKILIALSPVAVILLIGLALLSD